jgi:hypothetical protein
MVRVLREVADALHCRAEVGAADTRAGMGSLASGRLPGTGQQVAGTAVDGWSGRRRHPAQPGCRAAQPPSAAAARHMPHGNGMACRMLQRCPTPPHMASQQGSMALSCALRPPAGRGAAAQRHHGAQHSHQQHPPGTAGHSVHARYRVGGALGMDESAGGSCEGGSVTQRRGGVALPAGSSAAHSCRHHCMPPSRSKLTLPCLRCCLYPSAMGASRRCCRPRRRQRARRW